MNDDNEYVPAYKKQPGWNDKIQFTGTWNILIERAAIERSSLKWDEYYSTVETLSKVLFKDLRDIVKEFKQKLIAKYENKSIGFYDDLLEFIIDLLEIKGYLDKSSIMEENVE